MINTSNTKKKMILSAALAILSIAGYIAVFMGLGYAKEAVYNAEIKKAEHELEILKTSQEKTFMTETLEEKDLIRSYFLDSDDVVAFIDGLERMAAESGLKIETDSITEGNYQGLELAKWGSIKISISTEGSWESTYQFIYKLERLPVKSSVTRILVDKMKEGWSGNYFLEILKKNNG